MTKLAGTWRNVTDAMGAKVTTTQTIRDDHSFETKMEFELPGGGVQTVVHEGALDVDKESFRVNFERGRTKIEGAAVPAMNFPERPFNEAEIAQTLGMLDQDFPYTVDKDTFATTAKSPMGDMEVVYKRVKG